MILYHCTNFEAFLAAEGASDRPITRVCLVFANLCSVHTKAQLLAVITLGRLNLSPSVTEMGAEYSSFSSNYSKSESL